MPHDPSPHLLHYEHAVTDDTATQVARAAVRYRLTSPAFLLAIGLGVAVLILCLVADAAPLAAGVGLGILVITVSPLLRVPRLAAQLRSRGFRPGTTMSVDYLADEFVVTTPDNRATHRYADVRSVRSMAGVAAIRLSRAGVLLVLPAPLVPAEAAVRLAATAH